MKWNDDYITDCGPFSVLHSTLRSPTAKLDKSHSEIFWPEVRSPCQQMCAEVTKWVFAKLQYSRLFKTLTYLSTRSCFRPEVLAFRRFSSSFKRSIVNVPYLLLILSDVALFRHKKNDFNLPCHMYTSISKQTRATPTVLQ